jgi:hypothetical protein
VNNPTPGASVDRYVVVTDEDVRGLRPTASSPARLWV